MRKTLSTALVALSLTIVGSVAPAQANELYYVSGPAGPFTGYTVPAMVMGAGDTVMYMNLDTFDHDVVSRQVRTGEPASWPQWCHDAGLVPTPENPHLKCPLFWTPLIGIGGQTPIYGLDSVSPGMQYPYFCSIHANMDGTLVVLP